MNFDYINNIIFPVFIIDTKNEKICFTNEIMKSLLYKKEADKTAYSFDVQHIIKLILKRLADNEAVTFSYNAVLKGILYDLKIRTQYTGKEKNYIIVIIYTDMDNYISSADLSVFTEIIPGGLMIIEIISDKEYIAKYVNSGLLNMLGYTRQECEKYFAHDVLKFIYPNDVEQGLSDFYRQIKETGEFTLNGRLIRKNSTILGVHFTGKLVHDIFGKKWLYCSVTDLTQKRTPLNKDYDSMVIISLTDNIIIDGSSLLFGNKKILEISANEYFQKIINLMVNNEEKEKIRKYLLSNSLIDSFFKNKNNFSFELELMFNNESHWMKLDIELLENPISKSIIALFKWKSISGIHMIKRINKLILSYTHDLIWLVFTKTDRYIFIENMETKKNTSNQIYNGYEEFINIAIEKYSKKSDWEYLKFCFSIKNLIEQLHLNNSYNFVGHGVNLDGTPIIKLHQFSYFDKNKGIILYSRQDITNSSEQLSLKINGVICNFSYNEIIFIESFGRKSEITTIKGHFTVNENISSIQNKLSGKLFIRCHRSYIININAIKNIEKNYAILSNDQIIPINRQSLGNLKSRI